MSRGAEGQVYAGVVPGPFPGMDPWLEHPRVWPDVHNALLAELRLRLGPLLRPRYYVALEERTFLADDSELLVGIPDVAVVGPGETPPSDRTPGEVAPAAATVLTVRVPAPAEMREHYLEVREPGTHQVVTVVELLSPVNKLRAGGGRARYEEKRLQVLGSRTNLVEVDLLRGGEPMTVYPEDLPRSDYRILISRGDRRPTAQLVPFTVRDPIPIVPLPLRPGEAEPPLDLGAVLRDLYDPAGWDLRLAYDRDAVPPLRGADVGWADALLRAAGRR